MTWSITWIGLSNFNQSINQSLLDTSSSRRPFHVAIEFRNWSMVIFNSFSISNWMYYFPILLYSNRITGYRPINDGTGIHSFYFYNASSSPLLLRGAPDTARILRRSFTPKFLRRPQVKNLFLLSPWMVAGYLFMYEAEPKSQSASVVSEWVSHLHWTVAPTCMLIELLSFMYFAHLKQLRYLWLAYTAA